MSDRHAGYIVTLAEDIRADDARHIMNALGMVKGVQSVQPIVSSIELHIAERHAKSQILTRLYEVLAELSA